MKNLSSTLKNCFLMALTLFLTLQLYSQSTDYISKEFIIHRIKNQELKDFILEYDNKFSQYTPDGASMGIIVSCRIFATTIEYTVSYMTDIGHKAGVIVCEPINGKEVSIHMPELRNQIALPMERSVELFKNSNPNQYEFHKRMQKEYERKKRDYKYSSADSFVEWKIVFDRQTGKNVLRKDTPELPLSFSSQTGSSNTVNADTIPKEIITHRIVDKKLRKFISKYDEIYHLYALRTRENNRGINVYCTIHSDSIVYYVEYVSNIWDGNYGIILCEPINGKEVTMNVANLSDHIVLPMERSVELLKNSNPRGYAYHKEMLKKNNGNSNYLLYMTSSFPFGIIVFDKHTGKILSKDIASDGDEGYQYRRRRLLR